MAIRKFIVLTLIIMSLWSCEESFDAPLTIEDTNLLVVESVLSNLNVNQVVRLSLPHDGINGDPIPATGAFVQVIETTDRAAVGGCVAPASL